MVGKVDKEKGREMRSGVGVWGAKVSGMEREGKNHTWISPSRRQADYQYIKRVNECGLRACLVCRLQPAEAVGQPPSPRGQRGT